MTRWRWISSRALGTLLVLVAILIVAVVAGTLQQAANRGIPTGTMAPPASRSASSLYVDDVDGPPVDVLIGGKLVASVGCGSGAQLIPGHAGVPPLPWSLDVRQTDGPALGHWDVRAGQLPPMLLIRADTIALGTFPGDGPAPAPGACARWSPSPAPTDLSSASASAAAVGPPVTCDPDAVPYVREVGPTGSLLPVVITLTCQRAVAAAEALVGAVRDVASIEFAYGPWCPPGAFCALILPNTGHVIFRLRGSQTDLLVDVSADASGKVTASAPIPIPSASAPAPSSTCLFVGWYRANGIARQFADCAGLLVDPPATLTLRVGQVVEVHMTVEAPDASHLPAPIDPLPTSTDASVLRLVSESADGSTGIYRAGQAGRATLVSSGYCLHLPSEQETQGPCPALAVSVAP